MELGPLQHIIAQWFSLNVFSWCLSESEMSLPSTEPCDSVLYSDYSSSDYWLAFTSIMSEPSNWPQLQIAIILSYDVSVLHKITLSQLRLAPCVSRQQL